MSYSKILVTGGCGFMGSAFIRRMSKKTSVTNIDKLTYAGNLKNTKGFDHKFVKGDIANKSLVEKAAKDADVIINYAAETHVDRSIKNAESFVKSNVLGTFVLLEAARKYDARFIQISCYDEQTRALTTEGLKTYNELKKGDNVFSLNPKTQEIEIKPIEKVIIQAYNGKLVCFKNKRIDLLVTPNHKMFIHGANKNTVLIEPAETAAKRSIFFMPEGHWKGIDDEYFHVDGHGKVRTSDLLYILGIFIGDGFTAYQEKVTETKTGLERNEYLKKAKDVKTGKFVKMEKSGDHKSVNHSYRIFFDIPEKDKCRKSVETALSNLGIKYNKHKGKAGEHLYFTSKAFMEFFNQCGKGAHNKHIPHWALEYSPRLLVHLFNGLMNSDGNKRKIYFTVSKKLTYQVAELCVKLNLKPTVRKRHTISFLNGRKIEGNSYYVFASKTKKSISRHRNVTVDYDGIIWCLKIKDNKNFLVERNGKFDFCGNTDEVYGSAESGKFSEFSPLKPNSPYAASKTSADLFVRSYIKTYELDAVVVRSCNVFGPYQFPEKFIPLSITNLLHGKKIPVYGDGKNVREWIFVNDHASAIDFVLNSKTHEETLNIGTGFEKRNIEIARLIVNTLGMTEDMIEFVADRKGHDYRYAMDWKLLSRLGWRPEHKFDDALQRTVNWYKENEKWWKPLLKKA